MRFVGLGRDFLNRRNVKMLSCCNQIILLF